MTSLWKQLETNYSKICVVNHCGKLKSRKMVDLRLRLLEMATALHKYVQTGR